MSKTENVNHPSHYTSGMPAIEPECIDFAESMNFCRGNAFKYVWRAGKKGDAIEDLQKALWYLKRVHPSFFDNTIVSPTWSFYYEKAKKLASDAFIEDKLYILNLICNGGCNSAIQEIENMIATYYDQQEEEKNV